MKPADGGSFSAARVTMDGGSRAGDRTLGAHTWRRRIGGSVARLHGTRRRRKRSAPGAQIAARAPSDPGGGFGARAAGADRGRWRTAAIGGGAGIGSGGGGGASDRHRRRAAAGTGGGRRQQAPSRPRSRGRRRRGCARPANESWRSSPRAVGAPLPEPTDSRMRASSSSADCARPKARSSGATTPLSICMNSVSSSCARSPMGMRPAMRAPPLNVCNGRLSAVEAIDAAAVLVPLRQRALRCVDEFDRLIGEDAGDVGVEVRERRLRRHLRDRREQEPVAAAGGLTTELPAGKEAEVPRPPARRSRGGAGVARPPVRGAGRGDDAFLEFDRWPASMRASNELCDWKKPVDSSRCDATWLHGVHAIAEQRQVGGLETHAAVEGLAHPVFERRRETDAVARFRHARAARQRVAGAIALLRSPRAARRVGARASTQRSTAAMFTCVSRL